MNVRDSMTFKADLNISQYLAGSQAYRVDTHDGRIGSVAAVLPRAGRDASGVLLVRSGLLSCKLVAIPFDDVEEVDPTRRRVVLRDACCDRTGSGA